MHDASFTFLKNVLETPSPSGYERPVQELVRAWAGQYADEVRTDRHGNVIAVLRPSPPGPLPHATRGEPPRIMLAGHCDQIGLMVQHIDDNGYLYVQPIGGWDMQILLGQNLTVWTANGADHRRRRPSGPAPADHGGTQQGTAVPGHLVGRRLQGSQGGRVARSLPATPLPLPWATATCATAWPSRRRWTTRSACGWSWRRCACSRAGTSRRRFTAVSTVQEEIGLRGATTSTYGIHPTVGIAVDVCHATDTPGNDKKQIGDVKLGGGPVLFRGPNINPRVFERLHEAVEGPRDHGAGPGRPRGTGTDANAMQLSRDGVAAGLIGIPNRYMHSPVEVVQLDDLDRAARLLAEFCLGVTAQQDWTP